MALALFIALGFNDADRHTVHQQDIVGRARVGGDLAHRHTAGAAAGLNRGMSCTTQPACAKRWWMASLAWSSGLVIAHASRWPTAG